MFLMIYLIKILTLMCIGTYSQAGAWNCTTCPSGSDCSSPAVSGFGPPTCPAGTYSLEGDSGCTNCNKGISESCL